MITRLRPLDVNLVFEDRPYKLGETINLTVELSARGDVEVREGRVDLVCQVSWTEVSTAMVAVSSGAVFGPLGAVSAVSTPRIPRQLHKEYNESYVHSCAIFLEDTRLEPDTNCSYEFGIDIQEEPPTRANEATVRWNLVTVVDVARARDVKTRRAVKITVD